MQEVTFSHVALLVPSVEESAKFLASKGISSEEPETFESEGTKEIYVGQYGSQAGLLLLVEALKEGPYRRAMDKRGPSIHHIAIDVLNIQELVTKAQEAGWNLHAISEKTIPANQTAWLYFKGIATLIEVHQKKNLSKNPNKVSKIEVPIESGCLKIFEALGLEKLISKSDAGTKLTIDGIDLSFNQIACLK